MRDRSQVWCETSDVSIAEIDRRACYAYESNGVAAMVFISLDLYAELLKSMAATSQRLGPTYGPSSHAVIRIMSTVGELHVQKVAKFRNFLLVGVKEDFDTFIELGIDPIFLNDQERARIDQAFEDLVILDGGAD